jgi:hypothetical protein
MVSVPLADVSPNEVLRLLTSANANLVRDRIAVNVGTKRAEVHKDAAAWLWANANYGGLAIDGNREDVAYLRTHLPERVRLHPHFVTPDDIVQVLERHAVPTTFDFLKIDVDSIDCPLLDALLAPGAFRPKLFAIEVNIEIPPPILFSVLYRPTELVGLAHPVWDEGTFFRWGVMGCSASYIDRIAARAGYALLELVDDENGGEALYVRRDLIQPPALAELRALAAVSIDAQYRRLKPHASWPWFSDLRGPRYRGISDEWRTLPTTVAAERIWGNITEILGTHRVMYALDYSIERARH